MLNSRQSAILDRLLKAGRLSVEELAAALAVSTMTVRRDLTCMEDAGVLTRTHGGCELQTRQAKERSFAEKDCDGRREKMAIAAEAVRRLQPNQAIYLDTGTTALHLARALPAHLGLTVYTNNLLAAMELMGRQGVTVTVYGGVLGAANPDLAGEGALLRIQDYPLDVAFIGGDALDPASGELYAAEPQTAMLSQAAQKRAKRVVALVDSSKFGLCGQVVIARLRPGMTLITDGHAGRAARAALLATNAEVIFAQK